MPNRDPYYDRSEVSNSDLGELEKLLLPAKVAYDIEQAYKFGRLLDCIVTEKYKIDFFKLTCDGEQYTRDEFKLAEEMAKSFYRDPFCNHLAKHSNMQSVCVRDVEIKYDYFTFVISMRIKWDLDARHSLKMTGDIKSTTATTEKQFIAACEHFRYFRQRAVYIDVGETDNDMLIGISKVNRKVFKIPFKRNSEYYKIGKAQYQELAFQHLCLFGDMERSIRSVRFDQFEKESELILL